ncbi:MAG: DUF3299 domain-containing protein [Gammaproteobacteria bacterium]
MKRKNILMFMFCAFFWLAEITYAAQQPRVLSWEEMVPIEKRQPPPMLTRPFDDSSIMQDEMLLDDPVYAIQPNAALNNQFVKLPGFVVPLESDEGGLLDEFLFVPYYGACIHVPPPPQNQIVHVMLDEAVLIDKITQPYWIIGKLKTSIYSSDFATAVYQMPGAKVEPYEHNNLRGTNRTIK